MSPVVHHGSLHSSEVSTSPDLARSRGAPFGRVHRDEGNRGTGAASSRGGPFPETRGDHGWGTVGLVDGGWPQVMVLYPELIQPPQTWRNLESQSSGWCGSSHPGAVDV